MNAELHTPPHSIDAERGVLGACILDAETCLPICTELNLTESSFYEPRHVCLYREMHAMVESGKRVDLLLLSQHLKDRHLVDSAGGMLYIESLVDDATVGNCQAYADVVAQKELSRKLILRCRRSIDEAMIGQTNADDIHASLQSDLSRMLVSTDSRPIHEIGVALVDKWENTTDADTSIRWPIDVLHKKFGHLTDEYAIIMAAPSVGKTAFSLQMALNLARHGIACSYLSLESSVEKVVQRLIAQHAPVDTLKLRRGIGTQLNYSNARKAAEDLHRLPLKILSKPMTIDQIRAWAMIEKRNGAKCLFIDNLKHIRCGKQFKNRFDEFAHFSISLKFIRDDIQIPIIVLHHTNNDGNAAWSSDIRRDVDILVSLEKEDAMDGDAEYVDFQMLKQREGATGNIQLRFEKDIQTFFAGEQ